jgi:hypothetical protein
MMLTNRRLQTIPPNNILKASATFYSRKRRSELRRHASLICHSMAFNIRAAIARNFFLPWISTLYSITLLGTGAITHEDKGKPRWSPVFWNCCDAVNAGIFAPSLPS